MPAGSTYTPIATTTLGSAAPTVTFSSISGSYTDLVYIMNIKGVSANYPILRFNNDTGTNYSRTVVTGDGSTAVSERRTNQNYMALNYNAVTNTSNFNYNGIIHVQNYSNATTFKTALYRANNAATGTDAGVGLWRSTSAITQIDITSHDGSNFAIGSTFTLYGIAAA